MAEEQNSCHFSSTDEGNTFHTHDISSNMASLEVNKMEITTNVMNDEINEPESESTVIEEIHENVSQSDAVSLKEYLELEEEETLKGNETSDTVERIGIDNNNDAVSTISEKEDSNSTNLIKQHKPRATLRTSRTDFDEVANAALKDLEDRDKSPEPPQVVEKKSFLESWSFYSADPPKTPQKTKSTEMEPSSPETNQKQTANEVDNVFTKVYSFLTSSISTISGNSSTNMNADGEDQTHFSTTEQQRKESKRNDFGDSPNGNPSWITSAHLIRFRGTTCSYDSNTPASHFQTASTESNVPFSLTGSLTNLKTALQRPPKVEEDNRNEIHETLIHTIDDSLSSICRLVQGNRERQILVGRQGGCSLVLQALQNYTDCSLIVDSGLQVVYWLALADANKLKLIQANGIAICLSIASHHANIELIAELSCKAFCCLLYNEHSQTLWVSAGGYKILEEMLQLHSQSTSVVEWICRVLFCVVHEHSLNQVAISSHPHFCRQLIEISFNFQHEENFELLKWACRALGNLAYQCEEMQQLLGEAGACESVLSLLRDYGLNDVAIAESALWTLANLGYPNKENQNRMRTAGICPPLVDVLRSHIKSFPVVKEACICVRNFVHENMQCQEELGFTAICEVLLSLTTKFEQQQHRNQKWDHISDMIRWVWFALSSLVLSRQNRDKLLQHGLPESIVNMLKLSSQEFEVTCYWVCFTLAKIAEDPDCSKSLGNIGITRGIVICSEKFVANPSICSSLCQAIGYMANSPENRIWLGAAGTCECIVSMLSKNSSSKEVCHFALWAISNLVVNHVGNLNKIGQSGGCQLIPKLVLKYTSQSSLIAEWGTKAICNLSVSGENAVKLGTSGACDAIAYAILKFVDIKDVVEWGCKSILNLVSQESNLTKLRSSLVAEALESALISHMSDTNLLDWCCLAIIEVSNDNVMRAKLGTQTLGEGIIEVLSFYSDNELISERASGVIRNLAKENIANTMTLGKCGVCDTLVATMQCHAGNCLIITICLQALSYLAENEFNRAKLGGSGACDTVTGLLNHHSTNIEVVCAACQAISWLAHENEFNISRLGTSRACEAVTQAITSFKTEPLIAEYGCRSVSNLAADHENQSRFGECNVCEIIVCIFEIHIENPSVMFQVAMAIGSLASNNPINETKLGALGICSLLTQNLNRHRGKVAIAWSCCRAFNSLSSQSDYIEKEGSCLATVQAIQFHPKNELVCEWGCRAISNIARDQKNRDALVSYGACEVAIMSLQIGTGNSDALVAVMLQKSIGNVSLALAACDAIHSLGVNHDSYRERLGAGGACEALARILQKYAEIEKMAFTGCKVIVTLAENNYFNRSKLGMAGACKSILTALEMHRTSQLVATWGCRAVEIMVDGHEANIAKMGAAGVCDAVAIAMQTHQAISEVAGAGCGAVASLALHDKNTLKLGVAGACEAVVSAVQRHSQEKIIAVKGFAALGNLALNPGNSGWLGPAGACEALMSAIQYHLKDDEVAHIAWRAVANLSGEEGNVARFGKCGGCECLLDAMRIHISNELAIEECCRALGGLAKDPSNIAILTSAKVCETVVIVLQVHEASPRVCAEAYTAIFELASKGEAIQLSFQAEGGCAAVTSTLAIHGIDHPILTMNGFTAIQALSFNNLETQKTLGQSDACDLVVNLIQTHLKVENVVAEGLVALRCLIDGNFLNIHRLSGTYICTLLCTVYQKHIRNIRVAINACYVIYHLTAMAPSASFFLSSTPLDQPPSIIDDSSTDSLNISSLTIQRDIQNNRLEFLEKGIASIIYSALNKHPTNAELVTISCHTSCNFFSTNDGKFRYNGAGIPTIIPKIFQHHIDNITVSMAICQFLHLSCDHYEPIQVKCSQYPLLFRLLVTSLQQYYQREDYSEYCCYAMISLVEGYEPNRMKLVAAGAIDIVTIVLQTHPDAEGGEVWEGSSKMEEKQKKNIAKLAMRTLTILGGMRS